MGFEKQVIVSGNGPKPLSGQLVTIHCAFYGKDNDFSMEFWSSKDIDQQSPDPLTFKIGQGHVIKGWDEGVMDMRLGEVARLRCSPDYAFGASGVAAFGIQSCSIMEFVIELLDIE